MLYFDVFSKFDGKMIEIAWSEISTCVYVFFLLK